MRIILLILFFALFTEPLFSQKLKNKRNQTGQLLEEFTVLKENKDIKHGQYVMYKLDFLENKSIVEIGQFENGVKTGDWYQFHEKGFLKSEGRYVNGEKSGNWNFYFEPIDDNSNMMSLFSSNRGITFKEDGFIEIDKQNLVISSSGDFELGRRTNVWNYYSSNGELIHSFNYSTSEKLDEIVIENTEIPSYHYSEIFQIYENEQTIKNGNYICVHSKGQLLLLGTYTEGLKDGVWKKFDIQGNPVEYGEYQKGHKTGLWEFFDWKGNLSMTYDFTKSKIVFFDSLQNSGLSKSYEALIDGVYEKVELDHSPIFIGGSSRMLRLGIVPLRYPRTARRMGIEGVVEVSVVVTKNGEFKVENVLTNFGAGLEDEVLRVFSEIPNEWIPAKYQGEPVDTKFITKTTFKFSN